METNNNHKNGQGVPAKKQDTRQNRNDRPRRRLQRQDFSISLTGKHVFGAYFNMARTNFVKTINYVLPIAGVRGKYSESQIDKVLRAMALILSGHADRLTPEQAAWKKKITLAPEEQTRLRLLLFKQFPVLKPMMADTADHKAYLKKSKSTVQTDEEVANELKGVTLAECLDMLALMGETLTECRNFYTHKNPYNTPDEQANQYAHQNAIAKKLDKVIEASRRVLKEREGLSVHEVEFLTGIDHMHQVKKLDENGKPIMTDKKGKDGNYMPLMVFKEYDDFYFKITSNRKIVGGTAPDGSKSMTALSDFGLLYFCILFLSKNYAKFFIDESRLFEFSPFSEDENYILQEMLSIYRIRLPREHRIDSRDDKATLAMDIFGEMRRCPIELYDLLDAQGQSFFHDEVKRPNSHTPEVAKRLRLIDRFPHLALRYIDLNEVFKRIRFQLQLGSFRYKFYDKECIDGRIRVRRIQKDINGYGRLQEVEDKRMERWGDIIQQREERPVKLEHEELYLDLDQFMQDSADSTPYVTDRRPAYNIHANRIGLYWEESQDKRQYKLFDENDMYMPTLTVGDNQKAQINMPAPLCTLSTRDLPALLFYEYLRTQSPEAGKCTPAEKIIIDTVADYRSFFAKVADGTITQFPSSEDFADYMENNYPSILLSDIPEKIRLYLSGQRLTHNGKTESAQQRLVRLTLEHLEEREKRVERRLTHYKEDLKKIGDKENKIGKKDYADVRHGALARYLAQSMMEWQPSRDGEGHDKLTILNYNVLTAFLATYGSPQASLADGDIAKLSLKEVFTNAHLINGNNPHPFLQKVLNCNNKNIEDFYLNYLEKELEHIGARIQSLKSSASDKSLAALPFVHHQRVRFHERTTEEIRQLATRYTTIQLPDGLFTPNILYLLEKQYPDNVELQKALTAKDDASVDPTRNAAYLISAFYHSVLNDDAQPFYNAASPHTWATPEGQNKSITFKRSYELFSVLKNEKERFFPFELKPLYLTCEEIQNRLSAKVLDENGMPRPERDTNGRPQKDAQGNTIWQRKIKQDINRYVQSLSDGDLKLAQNQSREKKNKERNEKREAIQRRLTHQLTDVKNTERTLRRYKTQDMVLFLLAKKAFVDLLGSQDRQVNWKQLRLTKVCNEAFLRQTLTFRFPVPVGDKTIYVEQENMSLKNYGEFYRFLTDDRLMSLLENIVKTIKPDKDGRLIVSHTDLMSELAAYDQCRSTVFHLIQQIESMIIESHSDLKNPQCDAFWVDNKKGEGGLAKRNNFRSMLQLIDRLGDETLTSDERGLIIAIRNAFGHNTYKIDLTLIKDIQHLPEVATSILRHLSTVSGLPVK